MGRDSLYSKEEEVECPPRYELGLQQPSGNGNCMRSSDMREIEDAFNKEAKQLQLRLWKGMSRIERIFVANRLDVECPVDTPWPTMFIDVNG